MAILDFATHILVLINAIVVPFIFTAAFAVFIYGSFKFFFSPENSSKREEGRKYVLSAVIGFFVMVSIWGLVNVVVNTFGFNRSSRPALPYFGGSFFGGDRLPSGGGAGPNQACETTDDCRAGLVCDLSPCDGACPQCVPPGR